MSIISQPSSPRSSVAYVAAPETPSAEAQNLASQQGWGEAVLLRRRGTALAWVAERQRPVMPDVDSLRQAWQAAQPMLLPDFAPAEVQAQSAHIRQSLTLVEAILDGAEVAAYFEQSPYVERLTPGFEMLAAFEDEGDPQEIETLEFDAVQGDEVIAENLWVKASWLSFEDDDASLRFRFSFGLVGYEDVAADPARQHYAAALTEALFPESAVISANSRLAVLLQTALGVAGLNYVERIVYFNAPNGGAQFHQDVERGHLGVVFAQAHGGTGWLTLPKQILMNEIQAFAAGPAGAAALAELLLQAKLRKEVLNIIGERESLAQTLDAGDHDALEALLNRCPAFTRQLVEHGHCYLLRPGDLILLPQHDAEHCAWHTVFCLDEFLGEALSFAVRAA